MEDVFTAADKKIKQIALRAIAIIIIVGSVLYLDRPEFQKTVTGRVVSTTVKQDEYRSITSTTRANIRLDNGGVVYKEVRGAKIGDAVPVSMYKRKITGLVSYK